jgi:hypothetical protein
MMEDEDLQQRLHKVAAMLLEKTRAGEVDWSETDDENAFAYAGTSSSALIGRKPDDSYDVSLQILNSRGTQVAHLDCLFYDDWDPKEGPIRVWGDHNRLLIDLYEAALQSALDVDGVLTTLLHDLE